MRWQILAAGAILLGLIGAGVGVAAVQLSSSTSSLDEASLDELAVRARRVAEDYPALQERLAGKKWRFVGAYKFGQGVYAAGSGAPLDPEKEIPPEVLVCEVDPCFGISFYNYTDGVTHQVLVNAAREEVLSVRDVPGEGPLLTVEEGQIARQIADADPGVQGAIAGRQYTVPFEAIQGGRDGTQCSSELRRRCAAVPYVIDGGQVIVAIVDLSTEEVVHVGPQ